METWKGEKHIIQAGIYKYRLYDMIANDSINLNVLYDLFTVKSKVSVKKEKKLPVFRAFRISREIQNSNLF